MHENYKFHLFKLKLNNSTVIFLRAFRGHWIDVIREWHFIVALIVFVV